MTDRPILFSAPMVRALLDGRKTMTRRVQTLDVSAAHRIENTAAGPIACEYDRRWPVRTKFAAGDRLWVRESVERANGEAVGYPASGTWLPNTPWEWARPKLPSIHMPRRLSRLTLLVAAVRVERLQDISREDAIAEGIEPIDDLGERFWKRYRDGGWNTYVDCPIGSFASLWTEINGPGAWEANPWVSVTAFTAHRQNIDQMEAA